MTKATKRGILAVVTIIVLLALGVGLGAVVGDALGIRTEPATQMEPAAPTAPDAAPAVPAPRFTTVDAPVGPAIRRRARQPDRGHGGRLRAMPATRR